MKRLFYLFGLLAMAVIACKKSVVTLTPLASVNVMNAVVGSTSYIPNFSHNRISYASNPTQIGFGSDAELTMIASNPVPLTITDIADTTKAVYQATINASNGNYYSLFLAGQVGSVEAILIKDTYKNYTDSVCGVRFVNLSFDSKPISVDIAGKANGSEVGSLVYKSYTSFLQYPATQAASSYNFEIRDAATGNLVATYTLSTPYFHNATLAIAGSETAGSVSVIQDNDF